MYLNSNRNFIPERATRAERGLPHAFGNGPTGFRWPVFPAWGRYLAAALMLSVASNATAAPAEVTVSGQARLADDAPNDGTTLVLEQSSGEAIVTRNYEAPYLDLSAFRDLAFKVTNQSAGALDLHTTVLSDFEETWKYVAEGRFGVAPKSTERLNVFMTRAPLPNGHPLIERFGNLHNLPIGFQRHWRYLHHDAIRRVRTVVTWTGAEPGETITLGTPHGYGDFSTDADALDAMALPVMDRFGQLTVGQWPGKLESEAELLDDAARERTPLAAETVAADRSRFGGWSDGPQLEATGYFRVEKYKDQWAFVDPEGYLFWSLGSNTVGQGTDSKITGREELFASAPAEGEDSINFYWDNLALKYGDSWREASVDNALQRMRSWGLNTIGAWSRPDMGKAQKVPHTLMVHTALQRFDDITKVPDPFSDGFKDSLERGLSSRAKDYAEDPWLLGVFIHNELHWSGGTTLARAILDSGQWVPARKEFVARLKEKYKDIDALNAAWDTEHASFETVKSGAGAGGEVAYDADLSDFFEHYADTYFATVQGAMRRHFPNHLYLGCRFHVTNSVVTRAASRYCDVISVNVYRYNVENFNIPTDVDRPYLISEFHFGTRDYGVWGLGLTHAASAENQSYLYGAYLGDAIGHPNMIGAHWFQWANQPVTGRGDGENFGVGLVSVADRPHTRLIDSIKETAATLYERRFKATKD